MSKQTGSRTPLVKIYGRLGSAEAYQLRDFLHRCDVPFEWIPLESDMQARLPVCEFPDGTRMEAPTIRQVIEKLGWFANPLRAEYDLAIYGRLPTSKCCRTPRSSHCAVARCLRRLPLWTHRAGAQREDPLALRLRRRRAADRLGGRSRCGAR
jgi:hypothetical protein